MIKRYKTTQNFLKNNKKNSHKASNQNKVKGNIQNIHLQNHKIS